MDLEAKLTPEVPIVERMRSLFQARQVGGTAVSEALAWCLTQEGNDSILFRHEVAYVLGQLGDLAAAPTLISLLENHDEHVMVRHEAGEALGALRARHAMPVLRKYLGHESPPLRETCELAIKRIVDPTPDTEMVCSFYLYSTGAMMTTVDPVVVKRIDSQPEEMHKILADVSANLHRRYDALFGLRNAGGPKCAEMCSQVLRSDTKSALLRHQIAFVLGQMSEVSAYKNLTEALRDKSENEMVRHETALALGSVGTELEEAEQQKLIKLLTLLSGDKNPIVGESCLVALDNLGANATTGQKGGYFGKMKFGVSALQFLKRSSGRRETLSQSFESQSNFSVSSGIR